MIDTVRSGRRAKNVHIRIRYLYFTSLLKSAAMAVSVETEGLRKGR